MLPFFSCLVAFYLSRFAAASAEDCNDATCSASELLIVPPKLPRNIEAIIDETWDILDVNATQMFNDIKSRKAFTQFSHSRQTFKNHLIGTFGILHGWNQPQDVCRLGLFHTAYSGDLFHFYVLDASSADGRLELQNIIGTDAENLVYLFGTVNRGSLIGLSRTMNASDPRGPDILNKTDGNSYYTVYNRITGSIDVNSKDVAKLLVATMADYLDQMVTVNGWRDHHQVKNPSSLYPGTGKPTTALYWISAICRAIRAELDVIPPIFDSCTTVVEYADEVMARDLYWEVVQGEDALSISEQKNKLMRSMELNKFIAEPEILLAQLFYRENNFKSASFHSSQALLKLYNMSSAWDKRIDYTQWIAFCRILYLRSRRMLKESEIYSLPLRDNPQIGTHGFPLFSVIDIVNSLP
jgi:hypothetical protein